MSGEPLGGLIVTHGELGQALLDAAARIAGPPSGVFALSNAGLSRDALIDERELVEWTRDHEAELRRGLNEVRDRVQMTIRVLGRPAAASQRPVAITSGRAYLEARRRALEPELPPAVRDVLDQLRPLVARERVEAGQGGLLATVYHLISKRNLPAYRRAVEGAPAETIVSGPWPPFAFAPPLW